jgi:diacylglycerol kinase (ATP)
LSAFNKIMVIVNPASGRDQPILNILNTAFKDTGLDWDVVITKAADDARRLAEEAAKGGSDVVAVYGGDGTINEVAEGLIGTGVPLAIFPGGTANAIALALGIPSDLAEAAALVCRGPVKVRTVDMGQAGEQSFIVAVGMGLAGELAEGADRESKERLGPFAYALASLDALRRSKVDTYYITLDGKELEELGVSCVVANMGNFGVPGVSLAPGIDMADGLLDVIVIPGAGLGTIVSAAASMATAAVACPGNVPFPHWQARRVSIKSETQQKIQIDGEVMDPGPIEAEVLAGALRVIVPQS